MIIGGGPGGLLVSILLNNIGIDTTILEEAREPDEWSSKSYAMTLNERGKAALDRAGCLESVMRVGNEKVCSYFVDGITGGIKTIPPKGIDAELRCEQTAASGMHRNHRYKSPSGVSRPLLVECIETIATDLPHVTLRKGAGISSITEDKEKRLLQVHLQDGTVIPGATHVIGADGKWSKVRQSFPSLNSQANLVSCTGFGVLMFGETIPEGFEKKDGTYIIFPPADEESQSSTPPGFYVIASHLPNNGGMSLAMVCTDSIGEKYPWLQPEADPKPKDLGTFGWKDETSLEKEKSIVDAHSTNEDLANKLEGIFQETFPAFHAVLDKRFYQNARINRRASWLQMSAAEGTKKDVSYSTEEGNVALIGDAAHAMTASMGEGGNCAMESAVKLVDAVISIMKEKGETDCTVNTMNEAFMDYGVSRPKEVQPVQEMSAARNNK
eukprot:CAMPEP_0194449044 /NCGR_PEP_ID=MMETSP0176-20130528/129913_1 /TAXON_ID=216777 /ORGANISM="Proboscia alata, Strain PI-D3" /LENGTH=439 /DNA_ID=CAMNT_0039276099 /DNA_START=82 /DNA_END=1400 /DNA_ORIENTATION=-